VKKKTGKCNNWYAETTGISEFLVISEAPRHLLLRIALCGGTFYIQEKKHV
jgi:hypothetical protein